MAHPSNLKRTVVLGTAGIGCYELIDDFEEGRAVESDADAESACIHGTPYAEACHEGGCFREARDQ